MNDFVTLIRQRIKSADGQFIVNAVQYPWDGDWKSDKGQALLKQYFNLQHTDTDDRTLSYHAVFVLDNTGATIKGEAFDYREPEPEPEEETEEEA